MAEKLKNILIRAWASSWPEVREAIMNVVREDKSVIDVPEYGNWGYNALVVALKENDLDLVSFLLEHGADPNADICGVHSSRPVFFAKTVEGLRLLKKHGADLRVVNKGSGFSKDMNLLHQSINCDTEDNRIFEFLLGEGFDPRQKTERGANLWHSLILISVRYCPVDRFRTRAKILHHLGISPDECNDKDHHYQFSAKMMIESNIADETEYLKRQDISDREIRTTMLEDLKTFLEIMQNPK